MRKVIFFIIMCLPFLLFSTGIFSMNTLNAHAEENWKQEYSEICAKTQNAMGLTSEELKSYVEKCDNLQARINEFKGPRAETEKKIFSKRLKMCRDLYNFALEYKEQEKKPSDD